MDGLRHTLNRLGPPARPCVLLGQITAIASSTSYGYLLTVKLQPDGDTVEARPVYLTGGAQGEGGYLPMAVNDEVLIFLPGGDRNQAMAFPGPSSREALPPTGWGNNRIELVHSGGVVTRTSPGAVAQPVLQATTFQADLAGFLTALGVFMAASAVAITAAQIAAAAVVFNATPAVITFLSRASSGFYSAAALSSE